MRIITTLFLLVVIVIGVSFAVLNAQLVTINYYIAQHDIPLSLLLVLVLSAGCMLGVFTVIVWVIKLKRAAIILKKQINLLEKELNNLRTLPMKDRH